jgi:predicted Fe-Mo cluster-binding NifX family protein
MNVRLQYPTTFTAGIFYAGELRMNNYRVNLHLTTGNAVGDEHNVALDRVKYFLHNQITSSVFVNRDNLSGCQALTSAGIRVTTVPEEPVDQVIGIMLYCKLNAIMENRMIISALDISSTLGDSVWYQHEDNDALGPFAADNWWNRPSVQHDTVDLEPATEKVVKVTTQGWHEMGLEWEEDGSSELNKDSIVYVDFSRREN